MKVYVEIDESGTITFHVPDDLILETIEIRDELIKRHIEVVMFSDKVK